MANIFDLIRQKNGFGGTGTSRVVAWTSTPTSGNLLLASLETTTAWENITAPTGYTEINHITAGTNILAVWYKVSDGTETDVTITSSASAPLNAAIMEIMQTTGTPLDVSASALSAASVTTLTSGTTAATAQADEVVFAWWGVSNALRSITGYTNSFERIVEQESNNGRVFVAGKVLTAAAAQETTATWVIASGGTAVSAIIATFKLSAPATAKSLPLAIVSSGYANTADNGGGGYDTVVTFPVTGGNLYIAMIGSSYDTGDATANSIADSHGGNVQWTLIDDHCFSACARHATVLRAKPSASQTAASISIVTPAGTTALWWVVCEISSSKSGGTNGSAAIGLTGVNDNQVGATSLDITFASPPASTSLCLGILLHGVNEKHAFDATIVGNTQLAERQLGDKGQRVSVQAAWGAATTLTWSWATSIHVLGLSVEVLVEPAPAGGGTSRDRLLLGIG